MALAETLGVEPREAAEIRRVLGRVPPREDRAIDGPADREADRPRAGGRSD